MNITGLKRKINDKNWNDKGVKDRVLKYIIQATPELVEWFRKSICPCRIELNRQLYKELKGGVELLGKERDMITDEWKVILEKYGFTLNNHWRAFAYQVVTPYKAYEPRHGNKDSKLPPRPVNLKEFGAFRCDDGSGLFKDMTPEPDVRRGKIRITLSGKNGGKKTTTEPYYIPKCSAKDKQYVTASFSGNFKPILKDGEITQFEYGARAMIEFDWAYEPKKILSFDVGKRDDVYLAMNVNNELWGRTPELQDLVTQLRNINKDIDNKDKGDEQNHEKRRDSRYYWQDLQDKLKEVVKTQYISKIIKFALKHKCLICIDNVTTGSSNGEYGQIIARALKYECEQKAIPFIMVPTYHTSSRCYECGHVHESTVKAKKLWRPEIDQFVCQECGYEGHSDLNAAKNIALFGWNIWLYEENKRTDKDTGEILDVGLAYRRRNNCLNAIPATMLQYTTLDIVSEA